MALFPTVRDGIVYVGTRRLTIPNSGTIVALDAATGAARWQVELQPAEQGLATGCLQPATFFEDLVIFPIQDGTVRAFDRATGAVRWVAPRLRDLPSGTGGSPENDDRPVGVAGSLIVVGSTTGYLVGLDARTGAEQWRMTPDLGSIIYPIAADNQTLFAVHFGGQLSAVRASDGRLLWNAGHNGNNPGEFSMTPAVDADKLYLGGRRGFYALDAR
jgi:outer membrane protein assembly factor BamB